MPEKLIAGRTVRYDRLPGDKAFALVLRMAKVVAPAASLFAALLDGEAVADAPADLGAFVAALDEDAVSLLLFEIVGACRIDGIPTTPAVLEFDELLDVARFALVSEFGSLVGTLKAVLAWDGDGYGRA